jgi:hypothetical protein
MSHGYHGAAVHASRIRHGSIEEECRVKISGSYTIDAPRDQVWEALNDIEVLARVVPGCQRLEQVGENEFEGTLKIGVQAIKGIYSGRIRLEDVQPPHHYTLVANGRSANGVVDGTGTVDLEEQDGKTVLRYSGNAEIGGTLASVGQRLIEGASRQLINQSLKALTAQIAERVNASSASASTPNESGSTNTAAPDSSQNGAAQPTLVGATAEAVALATPPFETASTEAALPVQPPEPPQSPLSDASPRRAVVVPENEQLKPEAVVSGMISDFMSERPWFPWVVVAFLLGYILGRRRS